MQTEPSGTREAEPESTDTTEAPGSTSVDVIAADARRALMLWNHAREFVLPAFERFPGEVSEDEIIRCLQQGSMVLWVAWKDGVVGGALTEIVNYSGGINAVRVVGVGGMKFESWREALDDTLERFARAWNCQRLEMYGRKGWERKLPNWDVSRIMMIREVTHG